MVNFSNRIGSVHVVEWVLLLSPFIAWIVVMNSGTENGIGYYQQPQHNLALPLVVGAIFNVFVLTTVGFRFIPHLLAKWLYGHFVLKVILLSALVLLARAIADKLIVSSGMGDLSDLRFSQLVVENSYSVGAFVFLGIIFGIVRDWLVRRKGGPELEQQANGSPEPLIQLKSGSAVHRMPIDKIFFIKSEGNYMAFVTAEKKVLTHMTMAEAFERLPKSEFARIHRSYIVAIRHVDSVAKTQIDVQGHALPVGGKYRSEFLRLMDLSDYIDEGQ